MFASIRSRIFLVLAALLLPFAVQAQNNPPPPGGGGGGYGAYAAYELQNITNQALTFETYDPVRNSWRTHTIGPNENRRMAWHSGTNVGRIRIATSGRGFVEYDVRAGWRYSVVWSNHKQMWDVRTLSRG